MPTHWHVLLWPDEGQSLSRFVGWLTLTHTQRWHAHYHDVGSGHVYQGRFKSFPVAEEEHFLIACRYVERNAVRAGLVARVQDWPWGSPWLRQHDPPGAEALLSPWPVPRPGVWDEFVNAAQTEAELQALRQCVQRGRPFGSPEWVRQSAARLGLEQTLRPRGRPRKGQPGDRPEATSLF